MFTYLLSVCQYRFNLSQYLAAKAEEHNLPAKIVIAQMLAMYIGDHQYPYTAAHVYDYEFKLIAALEFDLIIFHPYRPMLQYCTDGGLSDLLATAWPIVNDSYRTDASLRYPPFLIAAASIYMAAVTKDRNINDFLKKLNIEFQELADVVQYLSATYINPSRSRYGNDVIERINNRLQVHFGPKIQAIPSSVPKKPPSSRPRVTSKAIE